MVQPHKIAPYQAKNPLRIVTAASLFDGHDASINIMRRILQASGAEVIHLGHNRSVQEIVDCAVQEDAQGIALTSYQGGHVEFLRYMVDLLREAGAKTKVYGGGGGTILAEEIRELQAYGVDRLFSPDDGREVGLQGMINMVLEGCDFDPCEGRSEQELIEGAIAGDRVALARALSFAENGRLSAEGLARVKAVEAQVPVLGVTGTGGAGKSSLVDELLRRLMEEDSALKVAVIAVDPTRRRSGGALLGDRIRMNAAAHPRIFMRSIATRKSNAALSDQVAEVLTLTKAAGFDLILLETSGIGQSDVEVVEFSDRSLYVMTSEYGAATQLEKIDMLDYADIVAINKFDKAGSLDAIRDVKKQYCRNHGIFEDPEAVDLPVYATVASRFSDPGVSALYAGVIECLRAAGFTLEAGVDAEAAKPPTVALEADRAVVPRARVRYLAEIAEDSAAAERELTEAAKLADEAQALSRSYTKLTGEPLGLAELPQLADRVAPEGVDGAAALLSALKSCWHAVPEPVREQLYAWPAERDRYSGSEFVYKVRGRELRQPLTRATLAGTEVRKVSLPRTESWGELIQYFGRENLPGAYPYTAGVFPLKRTGEDPARMFAGEGGPERTNRRFHYVSAHRPAKRLSTAFDSVTLYGDNPDPRPDIYGKVGNSGVSIATIDDAKRLYSGFDLADPTTSVSMTINGPAPILLSFFMNAAVDQGCEKYILAEGLKDEVEQKIADKYARLGLERPRYRGELPEGNDGLGLMLLGVSGEEVLPREVYERIKAEQMSTVRGTVQADILKEDQAQNTCIFSTEFALRLMGDIQEYFIQHAVRNFYSVSISGYHIAEAGANPITQLAFTLANGFTFVEYYLARGMKIDDFAPNLSFFFSNGMDAEYSVMGRVARRIWARAIKRRYGGSARSQKLKYHIQTSGRSLHAQELAFNDIRTTLQALYALNDNTSSLHTNAYDEAITTPTEESVRRALAIQLIINRELGLSMNENPIQGAYAIDDLTDQVEAAVLAEFERISERGGVLGAMERMYQRSKIQEESLLYEQKKHSGEHPIIGVNTFLGPDGSKTVEPEEVIRAEPEEKQAAIDGVQGFEAANRAAADVALAELKRVALSGGNTFEALMEAGKVASLGQLSGALYQSGGQYRRNM